MGSSPIEGTMKREWGNYKISSLGHECATLANIKGVADDRHTLFHTIPFWLRIGPITWPYSDYDSGHYYFPPSRNFRNGFYS